jgi:hypothetical protein
MVSARSPMATARWDDRFGVGGVTLGGFFLSRCGQKLNGKKWQRDKTVAAKEQQSTEQTDQRRADDSPVEHRSSSHKKRCLGSSGFGRCTLSHLEV